MARVWVLAKRFVEEHQEQSFDSRSAGMHRKHASLLLNPKTETEAFTEEQVLNCLEAMKRGVFPEWPKGKTASTLLAVLWGNPPYIQRMSDIRKHLPSEPPYYEKEAARAWKERYGAFVHDESH